MRNNWIAIYDTSPEGRLIYASESITEHTQFELDEIVGKTAYSTFHPSDHANVKNAHVQNVYNERMSSMTSYRHLCKNGNYIPIESVVICCYDLMVICNYILDENSIEHKMRVSAADECDDLEIVYASSLAPELLRLDPVQCLDTLIYEYLSEIYYVSLQVYMDLSKHHDMMFKLRFDWNVDGDRGVSEQVEGVMTSTDDGLVMMLRLAPRTILRF